MDLMLTEFGPKEKNLIGCVFIPQDDPDYIAFLKRGGEPALIPAPIILKGVY
jgi:hypothetical protein